MLSEESVAVVLVGWIIFRVQFLDLVAPLAKFVRTVARVRAVASLFASWCSCIDVCRSKPLMNMYVSLLWVYPRYIHSTSSS